MSATDERMLAFETSTAWSGVALLAGSEVIESRELDPAQKGDRDLLPAAEALLRAANLAARQLGAVAVGIGPGSYTGTRIGVMSAKALAYGIGKPLYGISSLAALAWRARASAPVVAAVQDARRDEVYLGVYDVAGDRPRALVADIALAPEEVAKFVPAACAVVGTATTTYHDLFAAGLPASVTLQADPRAPTAAAVGRLARRRVEADEPLALQPVYLRRGNAPPAFAR